MKYFFLNKMLIKNLFLILVISCFLPGNITAQDLISSRDYAKIVQSCFYQKINEQDIGYRKSLFTEAFLAGQLIGVFEESTAEITSESARKDCETRIVPLYVKAHTEVTKSEEGKREDLILAPLGSMSVELSDKFIQLTNNLFLKHNKVGHSDLTQFALDQLPNHSQFSNDAKKLIVLASQTPDLYRWEDIRYHAHTKEYIKSDRLEHINESKDDFLRLISGIMNRVRRNVDDGEYGKALFWMGVACHPIQDLIYHRGITLRQHAGLSYVLEESDPDFPKGKLFDERISDATSSCKQFIESALKFSGIKTKYLLGWEAKRHFNLPDLAQNEFGNKTDMNTFSLLSYWWLSRSYLNGERSQSELSVGENGLVSWNVDRLLSGLKKTDWGQK